MNNETKPIIIATVRGVVSAVIIFGSTALGTFQATGDWTQAIVAGGIAGLTVLATRVGVEGTIDQRASNRQP